MYHRSEKYSPHLAENIKAIQRHTILNRNTQKGHAQQTSYAGKVPTTTAMKEKVGIWGVDSNRDVH